MSNEVHIIETNCDTTLTVQKSETSITGFCDIVYKSDEVCLVFADPENDTENCCFLTKTQALILAEKILNLAISIKTPEILKYK